MKTRSNGKGGISGGEIGGIIGGVLGGLLIAAVLLGFFCYRRKGRSKSSEDSGAVTYGPPQMEDREENTRMSLRYPEEMAISQWASQENDGLMPSGRLQRE